jgi:hypothetical protein
MKGRKKVRSRWTYVEVRQSLGDGGHDREYRRVRKYEGRGRGRRWKRDEREEGRSRDTEEKV